MSPAPFDRNRPLDDDSVRRERTDAVAPRPVDREPPLDPGQQPPGAWAVPPPPDGLGPWPAPGPITLTPAGRARRPRRTLAVAATAVLAIWLLGAPLGLLWRAAAPQVAVVKTESGLAPLQPEQLIAADGWFSLLGLGFGVLVAVAAWVVLRAYRGPVGLLIVALGAAGAAVLAWRLGREIGLGDYQHLLASTPLGETLSKPPDLRAGRFEWLHGVIPTLQGDLLLPAFGAAVAYTLLAGWSRYATLRPETEPATLSWGSPAPQTPPAAPEPPAPGGAEPPPD